MPAVNAAGLSGSYRTGFAAATRGKGILTIAQPQISTMAIARALYADRLLAVRRSNSARAAKLGIKKNRADPIPNGVQRRASGEIRDAQPIRARAAANSRARHTA